MESVTDWTKTFVESEKFFEKCKKPPVVENIKICVEQLHWRDIDPK